MSNERRYSEEEIAEIFEGAAAPRLTRGPDRSKSEGLSLGDLQAIGREVGLEPDRIAEAAAALDRRHREERHRESYLWMPIGVGRTVELPRAPTDREWSLLVSELRETFRAEGKDKSWGDMRQWKNGNLRATIEPTEEGYRLRIATRKGNAAAANSLGITWLLVGLVMAVGGFVSGDPLDRAFLPTLFISLGLAAFAFNILRLPRWAAEREQQIEYITSRARSLIPPATGPTEATS
jgi:hypothetical protein